MTNREKVIEILKAHGADEGILEDARQGYYDHYLTSGVNEAPNRLEILMDRLGKKPEMRFRESGPQNGIIR